MTVTVARREFRNWLRESAEGQAAETPVKSLLYGSSTLATGQGDVWGLSFHRCRTRLSMTYAEK